MAVGDSLFQTVDAYLTNLLSTWNLYSTLIALLLAAFVLWPLFTSQDPDTHPFLLARQCHVGQIRKPGESASYRARETPHDYPLISGLNVKDAGAPRWSAGRNGDLRDVWRRAIAGPTTSDGQPTGKRGKILTVLGRDEVVEHDLDQVTRDIIILGQHLQQHHAKRVAIYLPNSIELLASIISAVFYNFTPILIPYDQPEENVYDLLDDLKVDVLIAAAGTLSISGLVSKQIIKQVIWVVESTSRHIDWKDDSVDSKGAASKHTWHELVEARRDESKLQLPERQPSDPAGVIATIWQTSSDDRGVIVEVTQNQLISAVAALLSSLPQEKRFGPSDLVLPLDALTSTYPLCLTLAALYANASVALTSVAGTSADLEMALRRVAPTVVITSAETALKAHSTLQSRMRSAGFTSKIKYSMRARSLAAGILPPTSLLPPPPQFSGSSFPQPAKLRLIMISHRAQSNAPRLSSSTLSDLRIFTGARITYALTAKEVAGAVTQTNPYDYRVRGGETAHLGTPVGSVEIKFLDTDEYKTQGDEDAKGRIHVSGPAVVKGAAKLEICGTVGDDCTLRPL
ncbi:MAG: hypothetical protein M1817_000523 [Caeruleum heppii]|nr:MAG: hypothetical protein M1817_000523 [Caeruleum heppii]